MKFNSGDEWFDAIIIAFLAIVLAFMAIQIFRWIF